MLTRYQQPPLVEAIYEAHFADAPGWSELSYKKFESLLRGKFSGQRDEHHPVQFQIQFGPGPVGQPKILNEAHRIRLWTPDRGELVQFSQSMCAFNVLGSYRSFDAHVAQIREIFSAFVDEAQPTAVARASQHYINRIQIPENEQPSTFFTFYPHMPTVVTRRQFSLQAVTEVFENGEVVLNLSYRGTEGSQAVFFLEILAVSQDVLAPTCEALVDWQATAHDVIRRSFEAALTDKCRMMFQEQEAT